MHASDHVHSTLVLIAITYDTAKTPLYIKEYLYCGICWSQQALISGNSSQAKNNLSLQLRVCAGTCAAVGSAEHSSHNSKFYCFLCMHAASQQPVRWNPLVHAHVSAASVARHQLHQCVRAINWPRGCLPYLFLTLGTS